MKMTRPSVPIIIIFFANDFDFTKRKNSKKYNNPAKTTEKKIKLKT